MKKAKKATRKSTPKATSRPAARRPAPSAAATAKAKTQAPKASELNKAAATGEAATIGGVRVRPLRDRVLVRRIEEDEARAGSIIVPDTAKEKPQQAEIIATGSGRILDSGERVPLSVKRGEKVLLSKWSGTEVKLQGEEYLILKEDEVLGILS